LTASCKKLKVLSVSVQASVSEEAYRLLDLFSVTDILIGDEDGLYHPGLLNDRLLLGLIGTMTEPEPHFVGSNQKNFVFRCKQTRCRKSNGLAPVITPFTPTWLNWHRQAFTLMRKT